MIQALRHPFAWRSPTARTRYIWLPSLVVALVGAALSVIAFEAARRVDDGRVTGVLEFRADWRARDFKRKLGQADTALGDLVAFIASTEVNAAAFHKFVRLIHRSDDASSALSWAPLVKSSHRDGFVANARQTAGGDFDILDKAADGGFVTAPPRDEYMPLLFDASFDSNFRVTGMDILSLPGRRAAAERARDEGRPIATLPTRLFARAHSELGFMLLSPVYSTGSVPATVDERRASFRGVAAARFQFDALLPALIANTPKIVESIEVRIAHAPLAIFDPATGMFNIGGASAEVSNSSLTFIHKFDVLGQHWTLISHFPPAIADSLRSYGPFAWLLLGLLMTSLFVIYTRRQEGRRFSIEAIVGARTSELTGANRRLSDRTEALFGSEQRFKRIFDGNPTGLALKTTDNRHIMRVNAAFCRMLGYSAEELIQRSPDELVVAEDRGMVTPAEAGSFPEWHPRDQHYITKSGDTVHAQVQNLHLGALPSGEDAVLTIANDITEQRKAEAALHQAQKMEAIGNLTGGMAHDFNNLLGIIIGNLDLLRELQKNDAESEELALHALDAALRGADLTRRLLAFARQQPLQPKQVAVNELVSSITKLLSRTLGEQIEISLKLSADVWPIVVDPAQLDACLTNLATNARDAMPHGGRLTILTSNQSLDADYAAVNADVTPGDYVMIEVSDTGSGMPKAVTARIFEPFYTTKERGKGTGLGLSMVFGFIKQSGGHITVYSETGIGTTFRLYLPRMVQEVASAAEHVSAPLVRGKGEAVLAVEDNAELRWVVVRQLTELGYRVIEAENAVAAIEVMGQQNVDLLLTDIVMPGGVNGFELANQAQQRRPKLRVLYTSGFPETTLNGMDRSLAAGTHLLSKPYRKEDLAAAVRGALDA